MSRNYNYTSYILILTNFICLFISTGHCSITNTFSNNINETTLSSVALEIKNSQILNKCRDLFHAEFKIWQHKIEFQTKDDGSLVSNFEKDIEKKIGKFLQSSTPWASFQGEEGYQHQIKNETGYKWYIDPIDGTISFKNGLDNFGFTLTLVKNHQPIVTLIDFPKLNLTYTAYLGQGSFKNGKRLKINTYNKHDKHRVIAHSDDYAFKLANRQNFLKVLKELPYISRTYTDIHAYSLVAEGKCLAKMDAAGALWDLFPGFLLVREAGGDAIFYYADTPSDDLYGTMISGNSEIVQFIHKSLENRGYLRNIKSSFNNIPVKNVKK